MDKARNCSIDILRLFFAILVVAIHTSPFIEYNAIVSYFASQTVSRLAVPFFGCVTGYFFFRDQSKGKNIKYIKKYLHLYSFWSIIAFICVASHWRSSIISFFLYCLKTFFLTGWGPLWYLLAIIYILVFLTCANKISARSNKYIYYGSFLFLAFGIATDNYGNIFFDIHICRLIAYFFRHSLVNFPSVFPFFMIGYALNKHYPEKYKKWAFLSFLVSISGLLIEILFTTIFDLHDNVALCLFTYPSVYFLVILALKNPLPKFSIVAKYCSGMATVIYFGHAILQYYLTPVGLAPTCLFFICVLIPALAGWLLTKSDNSMLKRFI